MIEQYEDEEYEKIERIYYQSITLRELHQDVSFYEHALVKSRTVKKENPFIPSFFLYIFFAFNTIYTINWQRSRKEGILLDHTKGSENKRINKLISFCFSETEFVKSFHPVFLKILTMKFKQDDIVNAMNSIVVDKDGGNINDDDKTQVIKTCKHLFSEQDFSFQQGRHAKEFCGFIYKVRCNIVHGTKLTEQMADPKQKDRILIYSYFLIAIQHMLFMFLEYKVNGFYAGKSDLYLGSLRDSHQ